MRVLHLPSNIASQLSITVKALRECDIAADGLVIGRSIYQDPTNITQLSATVKKDVIISIFLILYKIFRADIIHWHFARPALPYALDLKWAKLLRKPGVVEFYGSDIRIPEEEEKDNPYYARLNEDYEYNSFESRELSYFRQEKFASNNIRNCFSPAPFDRYLKPNLFSSVYRNRGRLNLREFQPSYPDRNNSEPLLIHSPTAKVGKGTSAVLSAIDQLKKKYNFTFNLVHGLERSDALKIMMRCDLFLDQFVDGSGYGISAIEAMAFGKPVICYIKPSAETTLPKELPVINANQDNLAQKIEPLLEHPIRRYEIGRNSRLYVERYHDSIVYAREIVKIYKKIIATHQANAKQGRR
jgi:hypothetical protein